MTAKATKVKEKKGNSKLADCSVSARHSGAKVQQLK